jgi:hypothetical protein
VSGVQGEGRILRKDTQRRFALQHIVRGFGKV